MYNILLVEDDKAIRECISDILIENNYVVSTAEDGVAAIEILKKQKPDLVILDLGLPKISGESVLQEIKKNYSEIPVIILTAKSHISDVVKGFQLGADDYVKKPFEFAELIARIRVKLKGGIQGRLQIEDLVLDTQRISVERNGKRIMLSPHEFRLLHWLMVNKGKVLSREMILNRIWQYSYDVDSRVVDVYIGYLRKKIDAGFEKKLITSVRGFGYSIQE